MNKYEINIINNIGLFREINEDNFLINEQNRTHDIENCHIKQIIMDKSFIAAVFDGIGGEKNGELASLCAAEELKKIYRNDNLHNLNNSQVITQLNNAVCQLSNTLKCKGGTTVAYLKVQDDIAQVCNVGDSRVYLFRDNNLKLLTEDHTEMATMLKLQKKLGIQLDNNSLATNALTQYLGIEKDEFELEPYIIEDILIKKGDIFLLCTDGLSHYVDDDRITKILKNGEKLENINKKLYNSALGNNCKDNITSILIKV